MKKRKIMEAERAAMDEQRARMLANAERTRRLAEKAQAELDARTSHQ